MFLFSITVESNINAKIKSNKKKQRTNKQSNIFTKHTSSEERMDNLPFVHVV